jgi:hypothetical protein
MIEIVQYFVIQIVAIIGIRTNFKTKYPNARIMFTTYNPFPEVKINKLEHMLLPPKVHWNTIVLLSIY